jgi:hypothetical protein
VWFGPCSDNLSTMHQSLIWPFLHISIHSYTTPWERTLFPCWTHMCWWICSLGASSAHTKTYHRLLLFLGTMLKFWYHVWRVTALLAVNARSTGLICYLVTWHPTTCHLFSSFYFFLFLESSSVCFLKYDKVLCSLISNVPWLYKWNFIVILYKFCSVDSSYEYLFGTVHCLEYLRHTQYFWNWICFHHQA